MKENDNPILTLSDVSIGYGRHVVASGLSAGLRRGRLTCLVGRNGVGKSTLLRTMSGFQPALSGRLDIDGHDMSTMTSQERARLISVVLTGRPEVSLMPVEDVVAMGRTPYVNMWGTLTARDREVIDRCIEAVGIESLRRRRIGQLSDGECQKAMIARALAQDTSLILLDEPTAFLDYPSKADTMLLLKRLTTTDNVTALLSTHDMEMAMRLADELWLMTSDSSLCCGTPAQLREMLERERMIL